MRGHIFTLEEANGALPLVRTVIEDLQSDYRRLKSYRQMLRALEDISRDQVRDIEYRRWVAKEKVMALETDLERYLKELDLIGCSLRDIETGLVDFPTTVEGKLGYFCWQAGENAIGFWHELEEDGEDVRKPLPSNLLSC
ncbi:MAG: DUF2203 domain-containing protein [Planctomycetota bacterium]